MKTWTVGQWRRTRWNYDKCSDSNLHILVPLYLEPCVCGCVCICMCVCENESEREIWNLHHIYHHLHHHTTAPEWLVLGTVFTHIPPPTPTPATTTTKPTPLTLAGYKQRGDGEISVEEGDRGAEREMGWDKPHKPQRERRGGAVWRWRGGCAHIVTLNPAVGLETHTNCLVTQPQNIATGRRRTAPGEALRILSNHSALLRECASWGCRVTSSLVSRFKISAVAMLFLSRCIWWIQ